MPIQWLWLIHMFCLLGSSGSLISHVSSENLLHSCYLSLHILRFTQYLCLFKGDDSLEVHVCSHILAHSPYMTFLCSVSSLLGHASSSALIRFIELPLVKWFTEFSLPLCQLLRELWGKRYPDTRILAGVTMLASRHNVA